MDWLTGAFEPAFMQRALVAGLLAAVAASTVGIWVVLRGLAFIGDALAHGVVPGVALAILWGFPPALGALAAALVMGGTVTLLTRRAHLREDTGIGLLFVGMLALGVLIVSRTDAFATNLTGLLFGDVLGVDAGQLRWQALVTVAVVVGSVVLYRPLLALAFHPDKAATLGMRPGVTHAALLVLVTLAVVVAFSTIGTLLVFGLLIGPPAAATQLVNRVPVQMAVSAVLASVSVVVGLAVSFRAGTAAGATVALMAVATFAVAVVVAGAREHLSRRRIRR